VGVVIGLVATVAFVVLSTSSICVYDPSRTASAFVRTVAEVALAAFRRDCGRYPSGDEGLDALLRPPPGLGERWKGPYIKSTNDHFPLDPWRRSYQYRFPGEHNPTSYDIWTLGVDGVRSDDDIGNW